MSIILLFFYRLISCQIAWKQIEWNKMFRVISVSKIVYIDGVHILKMRTTHDFATDDGRSCSGGHCAGSHTADTSAAPPPSRSRRCWAKMVSPWCLSCSALVYSSIGATADSCSASRPSPTCFLPLPHCNRTKQCLLLSSLFTLYVSPYTPKTPPPLFGVSTLFCVVNRRIVNALETLHVIGISSPAHALNVHHPESHVARAHLSNPRKDYYCISSCDSRNQTFLERLMKLSMHRTLSRARRRKRKRKKKNHFRYERITCWESRRYGTVPFHGCWSAAWMHCMDYVEFRDFWNTNVWSSRSMFPQLSDWWLQLVYVTRKDVTQELTVTSNRSAVSRIRRVSRANSHVRCLRDWSTSNDNTAGWPRELSSLARYITRVFEWCTYNRQRRKKREEYGATRDLDWAQDKRETRLFSSRSGVVMILCFRSHSVRTFCFTAATGSSLTPLYPRGRLVEQWGCVRAQPMTRK